MSRKMKRLSTIIGVSVAFCGLIGSIIAVDTRYAKSARLEMVELRLDQKIVVDRIQALQERMWKLEDRYGKDQAQQMEEYRRLCAERDMLMKKVK